ncbi:hypothetical protein HDU82_002224 [Entophlyctis luteolus]|nr:hypothetical protein HDU82_002224 [Entophlyctis luteolus]
MAAIPMKASSDSLGFAFANLVSMLQQMLQQLLQRPRILFLAIAATVCVNLVVSLIFLSSRPVTSMPSLSVLFQADSAPTLIFGVSHLEETSDRTWFAPLEKTSDPTTLWQIGASLPPAHSKVYAVPALVPKKRLLPLPSMDSFIFGVATSAERALPNLPVWSHWLKNRTSKHLSSPLIVSYHKDITNTREEKKSRSQVLRAAKRENLDVRFVPTAIKRYEQRVLFLLRELWVASSPKTKWFVIQDDDTVWITQDALLNLVSAYPDPSQYDLIIGAESETNTIHHGQIAYGGGGIILSRRLVQKLNADGLLETCYEKHQSVFGGDGMITNCVADTLGKPREEVLSYDESLHQLDFSGDAVKFFEGAPVVASLHHWNSWFSIFHNSHPLAERSYDSILLLAQTAQLVGYENFGRRFVLHGGKIAVHLGYTVVFYREPILPADLVPADSSMQQRFFTKASNMAEGTDRVTYFLVGISEEDGAAVGVYENGDGAQIRVLWQR